MKIDKSKRNNIFFLLVLVLLIIPQTRLPIQVFLHKGLALISPSLISKKNQTKLDTYNWELKDLKGNPFNVNTIKGKVIIVNFWATWCPPCIAEMPSMQYLYNDYKNKIEFIFISNESPQTIQQFIDKEDYTFNVYIPISKPPKSFTISSIPRTFLIDKKGNIIIDKTGASNWNSDKVREILNNLLN